MFYNLTANYNIEDAKFWIVNEAVLNIKRSIFGCVIILTTCDTLLKNINSHNRLRRFSLGNVI
jgi:hypothetical protein